MKKKKSIYYMLPVVILVWGFVFYQLYTYFFSTPNYAVEEVSEKININQIKQDTFSIVANYRDPFLGKKIRVTHPKSSTVVTKKKQAKRVIVPEIPWPSVTYNGMIKNNNSNKRVGIVKVGGKEFLVKEKDVVQDVTILAINKHQVKVRFQKETKTISK